jgi:hypothetical protein
MSVPTREQLIRWAELYVELWNRGDKRAWEKNWRDVAPGEFRMVDPVGTPERRGFEACALAPFDLFQSVLRYRVAPETRFVCGNEVAWVMENRFTIDGQEVVMRSIENFRFDADGSVTMRTFYDVPGPDSPLGKLFARYLPGHHAEP